MAHYPQQALDNALAAQIKLYPAQLGKINAIGRILRNRLHESQFMWN